MKDTNESGNGSGNTVAPAKAGAIRAAARAGLSSARENAIPGLFLWLVASAIIAGFYLWTPVTRALEGLGRVKASGGFLYSAIATGVFGGLIPSLWRTWMNRGSAGRHDAVPAWQAGAFLTLFWAYKGIEIDFFYGLQALVFGTGNGPAVIVPKVLVDQFVYNPLWAGWTQVLAYWFLEKSFRLSSLADRELWGSMGSRVVTVLISTWGVWIPMVSIIYAMPQNLQVPLFNIALCFWSLMLASLTREKRA